MADQHLEGWKVMVSSAGCGTFAVLAAGFAIFFYQPQLYKHGSEVSLDSSNNYWYILELLLGASALSLSLAVALEHRFLLSVGFHALVTVHRDQQLVSTPSIRWRRVCLLFLTWACFIGSLPLLIIFIIKVWRGRPIGRGLFILLIVLQIVVIIAMMFLHDAAAAIHWSVAVFARINGLPESRVESDSSDECSICLEAPGVGEIVRRLPCQHLFHKECIDEWLLKRPVCPLCNGAI